MRSAAWLLEALVVASTARGVAGVTDGAGCGATCGERDAIVGADGKWSAVRRAVLDDNKDWPTREEKRFGITLRLPRVPDGFDTDKTHVSRPAFFRTDAFKYCVDARRPWPTGCSSIGSWSLVLELTSYAATITSALLFAFTGDFLANRKLFSRFLLFIAYECLLVAVKVAYQLLRDTPPFEVKLQRKRVNFLGRKIVADEPDERKEDSDDESEEDEARHPLIVHDRDPEQNLEALRNPDAYRQNLA